MVTDMKLLRYSLSLLPTLAAFFFFSPLCSAQQWNLMPFLRVEIGEFVQSGTGECAEVRIINAGNRGMTIYNLALARERYHIEPFFIPLPFTFNPGDTSVLHICVNWPDQDLPYDTIIITGDSRPPIAWGFLVDASNSMAVPFLCDGEENKNRLAYTQNSLKRFIDSGLIDRPDLGLIDQFTISSYSSERQGFDLVPFLRNWVPLTSVSVQERINAKAQTDSISFIGGTWTGHALRAMIDTLSKSTLPTRTLVLFSDGNTNDPDLSNNPVEDIVSEALAANVRIMTVRIGPSGTAMDEYLGTLAQQTDGKFYEAPDCESLDEAINVIFYRGYPPTPDSIALPSGRSLSTSENAAGMNPHSHLSITSIVPNPISAAADIYLHSTKTSSGMLSLYSTTGEMVQSRELWLPAGITSQLRLETAGLPTGTYILQVETEEGSIEQTTLVVRPGNR